jgi:hypothetical protein
MILILLSISKVYKILKFKVNLMDIILIFNLQLSRKINLLKKVMRKIIFKELINLFSMRFNNEIMNQKILVKS